jgi:hypothetical protein
MLKILLEKYKKKFLKFLKDLQTKNVFRNLFEVIQLELHLHSDTAIL